MVNSNEMIFGVRAVLEALEAGKVDLIVSSLINEAVLHLLCKPKL